MENKTYQVHKTKMIWQTYLSKSSIFFAISALTIRKAAKKQQTQVQKIRRTVTNRNVTQDIGELKCEPNNNL